jgi:tetratricopeptide (TPR) repeat protein
VNDSKKTSPDSDDPEQTTDEEQTSDESESQDEDGLPEWEPLTPELVEDEAIRGDFVLRWAVVLLALLLGCSKITETSTLVHIKSGQYMAGHGMLPPQNDVFSYTADDRPWINLGWMFDLIAAGVFAVGGAIGLSLFKAILAAVIVGIVVHTSKPEIATWWGSVCAGLALLVWYPQFSMRPEIVTLLGIALTFWILQRWKEEQDSKSLWLLVPVFLLWSNLDPRMFLGLSLLLLYAVGRSCGSLFGRSSPEERPLINQLWKVVGVCFVVSLINPFGWHVLSAPFSLYGVEYPAFREYVPVGHSLEALQFLPLTDSQLWNSIDHRTLAGLFLLMIAAITFVLNWERVDFGQFLVYLGFVGFSIAGTHELAPAAIVCSVVATLNAQEWYKATFRQTYSVEFNELLFSRGGRAITVLGIFGFAYLAISGNLDGANGRRSGVGFHNQLQTALESLQNDLEDSFDQKPFNFRLDQGDMLIWAGQKVFVDSRVAIYHGEGEEDLLAIHDKTRRAIAPISNPDQQPDNANQTPINLTEVWKKTLNRFQIITHVLPRLTRPNPDNQTYFALYISPDWQLTRLGAATASFYRTDLTKPENENYDPRLEKYLRDHQINSLNQAFGSKATQIEPRAVWPHAPSVYQKYLSLPQTTESEDLWLAGNYELNVAIIYAVQRSESQDFFSYAYLAIRKANAVLENDPQSATAYRILGQVYSSLEKYEQFLAGGQDGAAYSQRRYFQIVQAYSQALLVEPNHLQTLRDLLDVFTAHNKRDLALELLGRIEVLTAGRTAGRTGARVELENNRQERENQSRDVLSGQINAITAQLEAGIRQGAHPLEIASAAYQSGCVLHALQLLDKDPVALSENSEAQMFQVRLLLEAGRIQDASDSMDRLEIVVEQFQGLPWRVQAAIVSLANAQFLRAASLWRDEAHQQEELRLQSMLDMLPFVSPGPELFGRTADISWPVLQTVTSISTLIQTPEISANLLFDSALCHFERGDFQTAESQLRQTLEINPETPLRRLVVTYLHLITDERFAIEPPSQRIPISLDMFALDKGL